MAPAARKARKPRVELVSDYSDEIASLRSQVSARLSLARVSSGLNIFLGDIDEEYVPDLKNIRSRMRVFDRMANDPQVRGQLRAISMTMFSGIRWKVVGGKPEHRALVEANLLCRGPRRFWCSSSWLDRLQESLGMLTYGFAMFGKSRDIVDGKMIFRDLTWLHPRSVDETGWIMDEKDDLLEVRRTFTDPKGRSHALEPVEASDIFLMTWDRRGPNWEGNAFIRPMYKPWLLSEIAEKIDIIDLQNRGVAVPLAKLSGNGTKTERDTLVQMLKDLRGGSKERAFLVIDKDSEVKFLTSEGQSKDAQPILDHHRMGIVKSAGTEYFEQGNTATGSRAGASALATGFFINVDGIRIVMEDQINNGVGRMPGLVQELLEANFDDLDEDGDQPGPCRIEGSRVSPTEQLDNVPLIQDSVQKGVMPPTLKIANTMLERLGWPTLTQEEFDEGMAAKQPISIGGRPNLAGPDPQGRDDEESQRLAMQEKKTPGASRQSRRAGSWPWLR